MAVPGWAASDTRPATLIVAAASVLPAAMGANVVSSFTLQCQIGCYSATHQDNPALERC